MLSHFRRGHQQDFEGSSMKNRAVNGHSDDWRPSERTNPSPPSHNFYNDAYPPRTTGPIVNPDLSRADRFDAYLLAIVRISDKRNAYYSAEVVSKLRQKERTHSFINKHCCLYVTDRSLIIFDRASQVIAETIPLENVDPTCVHADVPDTLNDIFMYRLIDRNQSSTANHGGSSTGNDSSPVVVFKCSNNEAKLLVDSIRTANGKPLKHIKSAQSEPRSTLDRRVTDNYYGPGNLVGSQMTVESSHINNTHAINIQQSRTTSQQQATVAAADYYKGLTEELNKCFDDIELFVRYLEALMEYTKELERDNRRKEKKATAGLKQMIEKLPEDRFFVDVLQKFKHSFNLLGELKHIIHNPNAPELIHYLLSPLQFILYTLRTKHPTQLQLAQEIWKPSLTKEARDLLVNCLTSKEQEVLRNLGQAWVRASDDPQSKFTDYRPVFFDGRPIWSQEITSEQPRAVATTHPFPQYDERQQQQQGWTTTSHQANPNNKPNSASNNQNTTYTRQTSPGPTPLESSTNERPGKNGVFNDYNGQMQNEHTWAIDRKRAGATICVVKIDRKGQNVKELTVRRGELIEIEDNSKKWWRARNFHGEVGHVPNNIVEEVDIEQRPMKVNSNRPNSSSNSRARYN